MRATLRELFDRAVRAVSAETILPHDLPIPVSGRLHIIAVGKAAADMMQVALTRVHHQSLGQLLVVTRHGHLPVGGIKRPDVEIIEAGHPYPDAASVQAADRALAIARAAGRGDHLLVLLSGGGSALLASPVAPVSLDAKQALTRALLRSGATIAEINCVRMHLSRIKGGRLALAAGSTRVTTWIVSDVPGDNASLVASGPTMGDQTTLADARAILKRHAIMVPAAVDAALSDPRNETPLPDDAAIASGETLIVAQARDALRAVAAHAESLGYDVTDLRDDIQIEARQLGAEHGRLARRLAADRRQIAIVTGGETTVTVTDPSGRGGRNLEYLLALAIALDGAAGIHALAGDTDGIDGTEDAAGGIVTPDTLVRAGALGLDAHEHLVRNDAYSFFAQLGDLVMTGPTLTNVNDCRVVLIN